tara:strand:+ start:505 stop:1272 length:768 start_codon:yes stop_codon:yes gene_type:complete
MNTSNITPSRSSAKSADEKQDLGITSEAAKASAVVKYYDEKGGLIDENVMLCIREVANLGAKRGFNINARTLFPKVAARLKATTGEDSLQDDHAEVVRWLCKQLPVILEAEAAADTEGGQVLEDGTVCGFELDRQSIVKSKADFIKKNVVDYYTRTYTKLLDRQTEIVRLESLMVDKVTAAKKLEESLIDCNDREKKAVIIASIKSAQDWMKNARKMLAAKDWKPTLDGKYYENSTVKCYLAEFDRDPAPVKTDD